MALSQVYGKLEIPSIADDEPVFIIRAQDTLAESAMQMYRLLAEAHGCQVGPVLALEINSFRRWHGEKKLPRLCVRSRPEGIEPAVTISKRR